MGIFSKKTEKVEITFKLDSDLFKRIVDLLTSHGLEDLSQKGIAFSDDQQTLDVVGESFCQNEIKTHFKPERWVYGFLAPEQDNKFDSNAVAIYLIYSEKSKSKKIEYGAARVGYLKKEQAKKVAADIAKLIAKKGEVVPVLAIIKAGNQESDNWGVRAYAKTDAIWF